jgi:nitrogen fixation protein NifU and related proteins
MAVLEDLYREIILRHYQAPSHRGRIAEPTAEAFAQNPLCGDEMRITAHIEDGSITDLAFEARGCSISQASADMMADVVTGQGLASASELAARFQAMMADDGDGAAESLGDLASLQHVKKYPVRVKCALLPWNTLIEALRTYESSRAAVSTS